MNIEEGKYYRRRDGSVVGPIKLGKSEVFRFKALGHSYTVTGRNLLANLSLYDLVEEVLVCPVPPLEPSESKFVTGLMDTDGNRVPQIVNVIESIQIKEGEYYKRRDGGRIVGPMLVNKTRLIYKFTDNGVDYYLLKKSQNPRTHDH